MADHSFVCMCVCVSYVADNAPFPVVVVGNDRRRRDSFRFSRTPSALSSSTEARRDSRGASQRGNKNTVDANGAPPLNKWQVSSRQASARSMSGDVDLSRRSARGDALGSPESFSISSPGKKSCAGAHSAAPDEDATRTKSGGIDRDSRCPNGDASKTTSNKVTCQTQKKNACRNLAAEN
jgi:hypothetical protein